VFKIGNQSTSLQVGAYDNAKKPAGTANWFPQTQFTSLYWGVSSISSAS
jgi:hypothetical protein